MRASLCVLFAAAAAVTAVSRPALALRAAPPVVPPLVVDGVEYRTIHERFTVERETGFRARVEARDAGSGKTLWSTALYEIRYEPGKETDVQNIYVRALTREAPGLLAVREDEKAYLLDLKSRGARLLPPGARTSGNCFPQQRPPSQRILDARGKQEKCPVHDAALGEDVVGILYGLVRLNPEHRELRKRAPLVNRRHLGGCLLGPWDWAFVRYCPRCREVEDTALKLPGKV